MLLTPKRWGGGRLTEVLDDPELWHGGPIGLQLIAKQFEDERLLAVSAELDRLVNGPVQD